MAGRMKSIGLMKNLRMLRRRGELDDEVTAFACPRCFAESASIDSSINRDELVCFPF
jgi:hypothetical protein